MCQSPLHILSTRMGGNNNLINNIMLKIALEQMAVSTQFRFTNTLKTLLKLLGELLLLILTPIPFILMIIEALITIPIVKAYRYYKSLTK